MGKNPEGPAFVTASPGGDPCVRADMCARHSLPPSRSLILAAPGRAWLTPVHITTKCKKAGGGALPAILFSDLLLTPFCITWDPLPRLLGDPGECRLRRAGREAGREMSRCFFLRASQLHGIVPPLLWLRELHHCQPRPRPRQTCLLRPAREPHTL